MFVEMIVVFLNTIVAYFCNANSSQFYTSAVVMSLDH